MLFETMCSEPDNDDLKYRYKELKKLVRKKVINSKKKCNMDFLKNSKNISRASWKLIHSIKGEGGNHSDILLNVNGRVIDDDEVVAEEFNGYFADIPSTLDLPTPKFQHQLEIHESTFFLHPTEEPEVEATIMSLNKTHAVGFDEFSTNILKIAARYLKGPLTYHLKQGSFQIC